MTALTRLSYNSQAQQASILLSQALAQEEQNIEDQIQYLANESDATFSEL